MAYDATKVPETSKEEHPTFFASRCWPVTPADGADITDPVTGKYAKYFTVASDGDVAFLGYENADGDTAQVMTLMGGAIIPGRIRRILATGTTATVIGWSD